MTRPLFAVARQTAAHLALAGMVAAGLAAQSAPSPSASGTTKPLQVEDLLHWERVGDPRPSPDGSQFAYVRTWIDRVADRTRTEIWLARADGSRARPLVQGSSPRWSPDGERLAYLAEGEPRGSQLHVMWMDTRESVQVTRVDESPGNIAWSPDGSSLAFTMQVPERDGLTIDMPKPPKGAEWAPEPKVITRLSYRRDRQGYRPAGFQHLFVVSAEGGTPRQVTSGDYDHGDPDWLPDGSALVFAGLREDDADWQVGQSNLYKVDVASGAITALTELDGGEWGPKVAPDGRHVAFLRTPAERTTYEPGRLAMLDLQTGSIEPLAEGLDRRVRSHLFSPRNGRLYVEIENEGALVVGRVSRLDGEFTPWSELQGGQFGLSSVGVDASGNEVLWGVHTDAAHPRDIARFSEAKGLERLTRVNADLLEGRALGDVRELRVPSPADGLEIQCWLVTPPDFDRSKRYPLILQIHGGPHAMYGADFSAERQIHAGAGYCVLYCNPRGSTGYGQDFGNGIQNAYPGKDYDDLMGCVDRVLEEGFVDPERLFVYGGSGGGVLTCWIIGMTQRFRAAVSMFPVTNWVSFVGTTDGPYWYTNFKSLPWEDPREHWERSPLRLVGNVTTPTMMLTGELDLRTPMSQTEEYYQALKLRKVDSVMVRVPDEYHGAAGRRPTNLLRRILYVQKWFVEHDVKVDGEQAGATETTTVDPTVTGTTIPGGAPEVPPGRQTTWTGVLDEQTFAALHELRADAAPPLHGSDFDLGGTTAYLSMPEGPGPHPGVVVIHEWWGLNDHIRHWADRLAADGYAAIAVDLYRGAVATTREEAAEAMRNVDPGQARETLALAHRVLARHPSIRAKKRGVIGWCFGGGWSLQHALHTPDLDACVIYYGRLETDTAQFTDLRAPILGVFGQRDRGIPPSAVEAFEQAYQAADHQSPGLTIQMYDAEHAFANPSSARYDAASAEDAWEKVRAFFAKHLKQ